MLVSRRCKKRVLVLKTLADKSKIESVISEASKFTPGDANCVTEILGDKK